jgi:hypothetical protein
MVSKLLLATQECYFRGVSEGADPVIVGKIKDHYYEIKAGIGLNKSPALFGAFPTDPYSHTPGNAGAQQPGMTGQVKEDFISRMRETGVHIHDGAICFQSCLLDPAELLNQQSTFEYFDLNGERHQIILKEGQLGYTFCQTPVIYRTSDEEKISVTFVDGKQLVTENLTLGKDLSGKIFQRTGEIVKVEVSLTFGK